MPPENAEARAAQALAIRQRVAAWRTRAAALARHPIAKALGLDGLLIELCEILDQTAELAGRVDE